MYHAILIVVEGDDEDKTWEAVTDSLPDSVRFVGNPWQVVPANTYPDNTPAGEREPDEDPEFDTLDAFDQHPEK